MNKPKFKKIIILISPFNEYIGLVSKLEELFHHYELRKQMNILLSKNRGYDHVIIALRLSLKGNNTI